MPDETAALRAEVTELRTEVERLRVWQNSHVCIPVTHWQPTAAAAGCALPVMLNIPAHGDRMSIYYDTTACAAAAAPPLNFFVNTAGAV
jgi:hypothetical protein